MRPYHFSIFSMALASLALTNCTSTSTKQADVHPTEQKAEAISVDPLLRAARLEPRKEGDTVKGYTIHDIEKNSAWDRAGFRNGDLITRIDGRPFATHEDLVDLLKGMHPMLSSDVEVLRQEPGSLSLRSVHLGTAIVGS